MAVADLDGDGDLDVVRSHVGNLYAGSGMSIEENLGDGTFNTVLDIEFCKGPKKKEFWPTTRGLNITVGLVTLSLVTLTKMGSLTST